MWVFSWCQLEFMYFMEKCQIKSWNRNLYMIVFHTVWFRTLVVWFLAPPVWIWSVFKWDAKFWIFIDSAIKVFQGTEQWFLNVQFQFVHVYWESSLHRGGSDRVTQGSILGTKLFTWHCIRFHCYADDTKLYLWH